MTELNRKNYQEKVGKLKNFGDFGETTQNRLNKIYESKADNVQPTKTSNVEVPNQQPTINN